MNTELHHIPRTGRRGRPRHDRGQTTVEYALVLLAAGTIALLVVAWANGGTINDFLDSIFDRVTSLIE